MDQVSARQREVGREMHEPWTAWMIAPSCDPGQGQRACFVARTFTLGALSGKATLRVSAQGLYEAFVNGARVGDALLTPGWTCYDERIAYQTYDVSDCLQPGSNRIEIWLGDGWYRAPLMARDVTLPNTWGDRVAAIAELRVGERVLLATSQDWKSGLLPITQSGIYFGEDYDARLEALQDSHGVGVVSFDRAKLVPHEAGPVVALQHLEPIDCWTDKQERLVYDFGQNVAGFVRFTVQGQAGASILVEHSEALGPEREFDNRNYRRARAALHYTLRGGDTETYAPHFTFMGYRYARVTVEGAAEVRSIVSIPISSVPEATGGFSCGVEEVNRLVLNTVWSQRANFIEVPTDCPQRDERMGWTGDAQVFAGTACWLADVNLFLRKYLRDVMHDQRANGAISHFSPDTTRVRSRPGEGQWAGSTGWGDAIVIIPWQLYLHYGEEDVLRECFPAMVKWVDYLWGLSDGPIIHPNPKWPEDGFTFSDWLQPIGDNRKPWPTIGEDCAATIYHFISTDLTARIADVLQKPAEASALRARADQIKAAFAREYISPSGRLAHNDQTSYALAFLYDIVPAKHWEAAKAYFRRAIENVEYVIGTGFIGTPALLPALSKLGMTDLAEKVFLNRRVPGWLYQVERGATTIWERWDSIRKDGTIFEPRMNSFNHYAYGAVCQWLFESVGGITPTEEGPGFDRVRIAPQILPGLDHASIWHDCRHGRIEAGWRIAGGHVNYRVKLPDSCEGRFASSGYRALTVNGKSAGEASDELVLAAGTHEIGFDMN